MKKEVNKETKRVTESAETLQPTELEQALTEENEKLIAENERLAEENKKLQKTCNRLQSSADKSDSYLKAISKATNAV